MSPRLEQELHAMTSADRQREGLHMTEQTPQYPQALHMAMVEWGRHAAAVQQLDAEAARLDGQLAELQRALTEVSARHADLGRQRHDAQQQADLARSMVEHGCQLAGYPMPEQPPAPSAPQLTPVQPPAPTAPEPQLPAGVEPIPPAADALGVPAGMTVTDPPDGGGQPEQPPGDFQPEPEPRRRRGGRRGEQ